MKILKSLLILTIAVITYSCSRDDDNSSNNGNDNSTGITITTTSVSEIGLNTAKSGGQITNDGGNAVTSRGIVWDINPNPTISLSTKTTDGIGTGIFNSSLENLEGGKTYYVRAYATNNKGTAYGNENSFYLPKIHSFVKSESGSGLFASRLFENKQMVNTNFNIGNDHSTCFFVENQDKYIVSYNGIINKNGVISNLMFQIPNNPNNRVTSIYVKNGDVYIGGIEGTGGSNFRAVYWKNGVKTILSNGDGGLINTIFVNNNNDIYCGGQDNEQKATVWKNGLKNTLGSVHTNIESIFVDINNNEYYLSYMGYWKNNVFNETPNFFGNSLFVDNNNVYIAGGGRVWKNGIITSLPYSFGNEQIIKIKNNSIYIIGTSLINNKSKATIWINNLPYYLEDEDSLLNNITDGIDIFIN